MKILYFGDCSPGAMGIINRGIKGVIDKKYPDIQFELMDWALPYNYEVFFTLKSWKNYDIIIVDPVIAKVAESGWVFEEEDHALFKSKLIPIYHAELDVLGDHFQHGWYDGWFTTPVCSINTYITNQIIEKGVDSQVLPIGINRERFKPFKEVKKIKRVGFIGPCPVPLDSSWGRVKRPELFEEICKKAGLEYVAIFGKDNNWKMYEDIDAIICTSISEGNPIGFLEAAACKIPFITTNVGIIREYLKVKTFETTDEAVGIIYHLNQSKENISHYVNEIHSDVFPGRDWENILEKYWIPYFKKQINV